MHRTVDHIAALVVIAVIVYLLTQEPVTKYVSVKDTEDRESKDNPSTPGPLRVLKTA